MKWAEPSWAETKAACNIACHNDIAPFKFQKKI